MITVRIEQKIDDNLKETLSALFIMDVVSHLDWQKIVHLAR